jgi:polysaccharide lyase-like protein
VIRGTAGRVDAIDVAWKDSGMRPRSQVGLRILQAAAVSLCASACQSSSGSGTGGAAGVPGSAGGGAPGAAGTGTSGAAGSAGAAAATGGGTAQASSGGAAGSGAADPCATAIFCDDFESYTAGQAPGGNWTSSTNLGTVAVDETQARSGQKSVKFTTQSSSGTKTAYIRLANATGKTIFPAPGNSFYGRMMFRLEAAPTASVHWTLLEGSGLVPGQTYHALYRYGGQLPVTQGSTFVGSQLMANYETPDSYSGSGPSSDCWAHADQVVVPVARWSCVEWQFDGPNNTMRLWLDGTAVTSLTVAGVGQGCVSQPATYPWTAPTFDRLDLGWESYQADDPRTLYIDDVVVSTTKVGCPP